jgi:SNF2 family DNA or RNA helicase
MSEEERKGTLSAEGIVRMPYSPEALPLLRAMPGARWDNELRGRHISLDVADRPRLLELADKLGLAVAPELRSYRCESADQAATRADAAGLYPFQRAGVRWLAPRKKALLADSMGLGKTVEALMSLPDNAKVVVVCPASLRLNWAAECKRWRPDLKPVVVNARPFSSPA